MVRKARARYAVASLIVIAAILTPTGSASAAPPPAPAPCTGASCWYPALDSRWQYQLQGVAAYASTGGINVNI
jgi:hypothetical protein